VEGVEDMLGRRSEERERERERMDMHKVMEARSGA
jgi:hypothetical protein